MLFNSIYYIIFLSIVFCLYWILNQKLLSQNLLIVLVSYFFYGWWDWRFLVLIAFTSLCSFSSGRLVAYVRKRYADDDIVQLRKAKNTTVCNVVVNLLILGVFKYYNFFIESLTTLIPSLHGDVLLLNVILPVGISFYTFQVLSYSIDVYKEKMEPTKDVVAFFCLCQLFPSTSCRTYRTCYEPIASV